MSDMITKKMMKRDLMRFSKGELAERLIFAYNTISKMENKYNNDDNQIYDSLKLEK